MYNPTTFEKSKRDNIVTRSCLFCHKKFAVHRSSKKRFCNKNHQSEYEEYGPVEYKSDLDTADIWYEP